MSERGSSSRDDGYVKVHGFDILRFNGRNNFKAWQMDCKDILVSLDQFDSLDAKKKPSEKATEDQVEKWNKMDQKACSTIRLCLSRNVAYNFANEMTAKGIWDKLQDMYLQNDQMSVMYLQKKLFTFRLQPGKLMTDHINEFECLYSDCVSLGAKFEDSQKALFLLISLLPEWEPFVDQMTTLKKEKFVYSDIVQAVLAKASRKSASNEEVQEHGLSVTRGRNINKNNNNNRRNRSKSRGRDMSKVECYKCKRKGHYKRDCPELKDNHKKQENENRGVVNVAETPDVVEDILIGGDLAQALIICMMVGC